MTMRPERRDRSKMGMRGLLLWLALGSLLWYRLIGWPPPALPPLPQTLPSWAMVDVWVRSPLATDWTGFVATIGLVGWAFWAWAWATVLLEVLSTWPMPRRMEPPGCWLREERCAR